MSQPPDNLIELPFGKAAPEEVFEGGPPPPDLRVAAVEACLFANPGVLSTLQLAVALRSDEPTVLSSLEALSQRLVSSGSGLRLVQVAEGWQLRTEARMAPWVAAIRGTRPFKLSRAALETLSVIAYRQPVAKAVVDEIRGVDCGGVLRMLLERGLVRAVGRSDEPGRPLTYGTAPLFLHTFGLRSLADLPNLRDFRALESDDAEAGPVNVIPFGEPR